MARVCQVTGKRPMVGNNVSHANNKTKRRFLPNLQYRRFWVETENRWVRLRVTNAALRLIDKIGIEQVVADLRAAAKSELGARPWHKGGREKIKLESTRRHRSLLHDRQEQEDHAGEDGDHEVRPEGAQARDLQGNEAEVDERWSLQRPLQAAADREVARPLLLLAECRKGRRGDPACFSDRELCVRGAQAQGEVLQGGDAALFGLAGTRPAGRRRAARPRRWCASTACAAPRAS